MAQDLRSAIEELSAVHQALSVPHPVRLDTTATVDGSQPASLSLSASG